MERRSRRGGVFERRDGEGGERKREKFCIFKETDWIKE